jgi:hypothetical protein
MLKIQVNPIFQSFPFLLLFFFCGKPFFYFLNIVFLFCFILLLLFFFLGKHWFSKSLNEWGFSKFLSLTDLQDSSKGFLENDTLIVQGEILLMSTIK